jgi:hypothetical protein
VSKNSESLPLRNISGIVSVIAFLADLITIALFIRDLLGNVPIPLGTALAQVALIVAVFMFAFFLLLYSRREGEYESLDEITWIFGWLYITFSAAIFGIVAYRFIVEANYEFWDFMGYTMLIALIAGLGFGIAFFIAKRPDYFSIPFMLVALEQIILWILQLLSRKAISFNWAFIGNLLLFAYAGSFVLFFISSSSWIEKVKLR